MLFDGFRREFITVDGVDLHAVIGGDGPPFLLLHGYPQSHLMWHRVAPQLARRYTVVVPDLRGYGDSAKPASDPDHVTYCKRTNARDQVELMATLGYDRFYVAGHDRGARITHRMALDHPDAVLRAAVLDIAPTLTVFETVSQATATDYYHWFFLTRPHGFPEHMIGLDPETFLKNVLGRFWENREAFTEEVMAEYVRCFSDPATIHASCEDYRAGATIDLDHDRADRAAGNLVDCPLLVLWGLNGRVEKNFDVMATWREKARDVRGHGVASGHFIPEEAPAETLAAFEGFFVDD